MVLKYSLNLIIKKKRKFFILIILNILEVRNDDDDDDGGPFLYIGGSLTKEKHGNLFDSFFFVIYLVEHMKYFFQYNQVLILILQVTNK
jgi:hypothetical protein